MDENSKKEDEEKHNKQFEDDSDEELTDEEIIQILEEERFKSYDEEDEDFVKKPPSLMKKMILWGIVFLLMMNLIAIIPQTFSIPAVKFLSTSASLSKQENIQTYKEAVVVIEADESKGTGFSFTSSGDILTNYHVVEGNQEVSVFFPKAGMYMAEVTETYPDIDLAVLEIEENHDALPQLNIADHFELKEEEPIYFIGNPLKFTGIANQGKVLDYTQVSSKEKPVVMLDAPVYRGNSGSPVIDDTGNVIGVIFATLFHDDEGRVGLFIPIDYFHEARKD